MKGRALLAIAAVIPGMFLVQTSGGTTVAVVDFRRAVEETPEGKSAITKLTTFGTEQEAAIKQKVKEAEDLDSQIRAQNGVRSDVTRAQLQRDLDAARVFSRNSPGEDPASNLERREFCAPDSATGPHVSNPVSHQARKELAVS